MSEAKHSKTETAHRSKASARLWTLAIPAVLAVAAVIVAFRPAKAQAKAETDSELLEVAATKIHRDDLASEIVFNSEFRPYQEVDLHAKIAGYLESIGVDIGDQIKEKQLIATLEVPELQSDIDRASASERRSKEEIRRAQAAYEEAHLAYTRLTAVQKAQPHLIADQDIEIAQTKDRTGEANLAAAKEQAQVAAAELKKLQTMLQYTKITAPFSGVITKRYADKGALIQAGISSSTQAMPVVRLCENDRLRLVFPVSVSYVSQIHLGDAAEIRIPSLNKTIAGTVTRFTRTVDLVTRTMDTEVDVPNPDLQLIPGMYASVRIKTDHKQKVLVVPVEALSRANGTSVYLVNKDNVIEDRTVKIGLETPSKVEILAGLQENDLVMVGSRTQVKPGQKVKPKIIDLPSADNL